MRRRALIELWCAVPRRAGSFLLLCWCSMQALQPHGLRGDAALHPRIRDGEKKEHENAYFVSQVFASSSKCSSRDTKVTVSVLVTITQASKKKKKTPIVEGEPALQSSGRCSVPLTDTPRERSPPSPPPPRSPAKLLTSVSARSEEFHRVGKQQRKSTWQPRQDT